MRSLWSVIVWIVALPIAVCGLVRLSSAIGQLPAALAWTLSLLLVGLFVYCAIFNANLFFRSLVLRRPAKQSILPFAGGVLGYLGLKASPVEWMGKYAWAALVLHVGCGPYFLLLVPGLVIDEMRFSCIDTGS
jgi:hypothetical protein